MEAEKRIEQNGLSAEETLDALEEVKSIMKEYGTKENIFEIKDHIIPLMDRLHTSFSSGESFREPTEEEKKTKKGPILAKRTFEIGKGTKLE